MDWRLTTREIVLVIAGVVIGWLIGISLAGRYELVNKSGYPLIRQDRIWGDTYIMRNNRWERVK